jgi:hypothetical protein
MKSWNSSPHPISDIRDWKQLERLEIKPDFQRLEVWSDAAKVMLMDTILRGIPMPKIFVSSVIRNDQVHRTVIDGQQRISAILAFMADKFSLDRPYVGEFKGLYFSGLPEEIRSAFLQYRIDFNEALEFSEEELRETYSRLNKYSVALTKQELRRADYPGAFLKMAEELANHDYLEKARIFTVANRRRLADVEYVSELVAALVAGPQDKRDNLDSFYLQYSAWNEEDRQRVEARFLGVIADLSLIFSDEFPIDGTRFRQKADFYSLLLAVDELRSAGGGLNGVDVSPLREDLKCLDQIIAPESDVRDCRDYAIKCVSQANSQSSRKWRLGFLRSFLAGTYLRKPPSGDAAVLFYRLLADNGDPMCPPQTYGCDNCAEDIPTNEKEFVGWRKDSNVFQMDNAVRLHEKCLDIDKWVVLSDVGVKADLTFSEDEQLPLV